VALGIIFLSYTIITGMGSAISLAQLSFAAIGALTACELSTYHGWPVLLGVLAGGIVAVPFGIAIALPAMRWAGLYLALGTLAFAFLVDNLIFTIPRYNNFGSGPSLARPSLGGFTFSSDRSFFYLTVVVFAVIGFFVIRLRSSTQGLLLGAVRGSERASASIGYSTVRAKLALFAISSFVAGIGGGMYAAYSGRAAPSQFAAMVGVTLMAVVVTMGTRSVLAALLAGIAFSVMPQLFSYYLSPTWQQVPAILFGLGAIGLSNEPRGVLVHAATTARRLRQRFSGGPPARAEQAQAAHADPARTIALNSGAAS